MIIASAVVHALPQRVNAVRSQLSLLPGVEIHAATQDGRFVVTVEDTPNATVADIVIELHRLVGVLSATMVYQYCDETPAVNEDLP